MTRAYREYYLEDAMESLGAILEDAVMLFKVPLERFWPLFLASPLSRRFAAGDPLLLAGKSGWEIAVQVLEDAGVSFPHERPDVLRARTPEYWAGWALAQYQWYRAAHPTTRLRELRKAAGLTRDQLGALAQVSSRLIEQYEQRRRDINAARADAFLSLARALHCPPEALLERV